MEKEDIHLNDVKRILIGESPAEFLIEVFVRTLIVYFFCLILIRLLGKRMSGQISITEMAIMLLLGAIISVPVQFAERGILQGLLLLTGTLLLYNGVNWWGFKHEKAEARLQGKATMLVKDSTLQLDAMKQARVSEHQLFAVLRSKNYENLGKVKRVYLEACGMFSIYDQEEEKPGLVLFPHMDPKAIAAKMDRVENEWACINCGSTSKSTPMPKKCGKCQQHEFVQAFKSKKT